jgi:hypothetical protein
LECGGYEYRYGIRGVLKPGDKFRVSGGPVYITDDGVEHSVADRGIFKFRRYCVQGAQKWLEAHTADGSSTVTLYVGKPCRSAAVPNLRKKPYNVRKVTDRKRRKKTAKKAVYRRNPWPPGIARAAFPR